MYPRKFGSYVFAKPDRLSRLLIKPWNDIWHGSKKRLSVENGSALVLSTFLLVLFCTMAGFALDGSHAYLQRRKMQTAADAAALAGAHLLSFGFANADVDTEIQAVATLNEADSVTWSYVTEPLSIQVTTQRTIDTYFSRIFGVNSLSVAAESKAGHFPVSSANYLLPVTLECSEVAGFVPGQIYQFWRNTGSNTGNFGWLDWTGGASSSLELAEHIDDVSSSGVRSIGEWVEGSNGVESSSSVRSALDNWIGQSVMIPLYDSISGTGGNLQYRFCGFARFTMTDYNFNGSNKRIEGSFELFTLQGNAGDPSTDDYGTRTVKLIS